MSSCHRFKQMAIVLWVLDDDYVCKFKGHNIMLHVFM